MKTEIVHIEAKAFESLFIATNLHIWRRIMKIDSPQIFISNPNANFGMWKSVICCYQM